MLIKGIECIYIYSNAHLEFFPQVLLVSLRYQMPPVCSKVHLRFFFSLFHRLRLFLPLRWDPNRYQVSMYQSLDWCNQLCGPHKPTNHLRQSVTYVHIVKFTINCFNGAMCVVLSDTDGCENCECFIARCNMSNISS